jgi:hypothetical protein
VNQLEPDLLEPMVMLMDQLVYQLVYQLVADL